MEQFGPCSFVLSAGAGRRFGGPAAARVSCVSRADLQRNTIAFILLQLNFASLLVRVPFNLSFYVSRLHIFSDFHTGIASIYDAPQGKNGFGLFTFFFEIHYR